MSASLAKEHSWMQRPLGTRRVDGGTWAVLLLWAMPFFLLPGRPRVDDVINPPPPDCMVTAWSAPLSELPLALRPDLIALPSAVSFGASEPETDTLYGVPPFRSQMERPLPLSMTLAEDASLPDSPGFGVPRILADAAQDVGRLRIPDGYYTSIPEGISASSPGRIVLYSEGLKNTQMSDDILKTLGAPEGGRRIEMELWIAFDTEGRPTEIFLEKGGEDPVANRELVRKLWNPANWTQATGQGRVSIRW